MALILATPVALAQESQGSQDTPERAGSITNSITLVLPAGLTDPNLSNNQAADTDFARGAITIRGVGQGLETLTASGASDPVADQSLQAVQFAGAAYEAAVSDTSTSLDGTQDFTDEAMLDFAGLAQGVYRFQQGMSDNSKLVAVDCQISDLAAGSQLRTLAAEEGASAEALSWSVLSRNQAAGAFALDADENGLEVALTHGEHIDCMLESREVELSVDIAWHANGCGADAATVNGQGQYTAGSYLELDECLIFTVQNSGQSPTSSELSIAAGLVNELEALPAGLTFPTDPVCTASEGSTCPEQMAWANGALSFSADDGAALAPGGALTLVVATDFAADLAGEMRFGADLYDPYDREADEVGERGQSLVLAQNTVADIAVAQDDLEDLLAAGGVGQVPDIFKAFEKNTLRTHVCNYGPSDVIATTFGSAPITPQIALPDGLLVTEYACKPTTLMAVAQGGQAVPGAGEQSVPTIDPLSEAICGNNNAADHLDQVTNGTVLSQEMFLPAYSCVELGVGFRLAF